MVSLADMSLQRPPARRLRRSLEAIAARDNGGSMLAKALPKNLPTVGISFTVSERGRGSDFSQTTDFEKVVCGFLDGVRHARMVRRDVILFYRGRGEIKL